MSWGEITVAFIAGGGVVTIVLQALFSRKDRAVVRYEKLVNDLSTEVDRLGKDNEKLRKELVDERTARRALEDKLGQFEKQLAALATGKPVDSPIHTLARLFGVI